MHSHVIITNFSGTQKCYHKIQSLPNDNLGNRTYNPLYMIVAFE